MSKTEIIAEIGINHNGSIDIAKKLIDAAVLSGCDYVKFQKRTPDICVPESQKQKIRSTPWGDMPYIDYKKRIEFEHEEYDTLMKYSKEKGVGCFSSVWDKPSVDFMTQYTNIGKVGSASITDLDLCRYAREKFDFLIISTGMSVEKRSRRVYGGLQSRCGYAHQFFLSIFCKGVEFELYIVVEK